MSIRWILPNLGTAPATSITSAEDIAVLDVRDLVDKSGNVKQAITEKIEAGLAHLQNGKRLVVACDYGISRSNAIAAGILAKLEQISVDDAIRRVISKTGEQEIKLELLNAVHSVLTEDKAPRTRGGKTDKILITGAGGFLGAAVFEKLHQTGMQIFVPSRREVDLIKSRAELDILIREQGVQCLVHLANPRVYTSNLAMGDTIAMLRNVLEACALNNVKLIYPSGWEVYSGYRTANLLADERLPLLPHGPYGETKWLSEQLINHFRLNASLLCTILRMTPVYGPNGTRPKFIYNFAQKASNNERIVTHRYRNAPAALDLLHRDDAVNAIALAATSSYTGDLNIGTGNLTSTEQVARWIVEWAGSKSDIGSVPIDADLAGISMDSKRALDEIGWSATIGVQEGLHAAMNAFFTTQNRQDA